jgi:hypothetical protein
MPPEREYFGILSILVLWDIEPAIAFSDVKQNSNITIKNKM